MQRIKSILKKIGSKNGVRLMFLSVYVFGFAIPAGYAYFAAYPAKEAIFTDEGTAHFQYRVKRGYMLMVRARTTAAKVRTPDPIRIVLPVRTILRDWTERSSPWTGSFSLSICLSNDAASSTYVTPANRNCLRTISGEIFNGKGKRAGIRAFAFILLFLGLLLAEWVGRIRKRNERRLD